MNVYLFEIRRQWRGIAISTTVLSIFLVIMISVFYPVFTDSREAIEAALAGFPPAFVAAFGMMLDDIFSYGGFSTFIFMYISLGGGIMAASLGISIISREKRARCTDFLLTKPLNRAELYFAKLLAALTLILSSNVFYIAVSVLLYLSAGENADKTGNALLAASAILWVELIFLAAGFFFGMFARKVRTVSGSAMVLGFGGFILTALHSILEDDWLRYLAPYKYFDILLAYSAGKFEIEFVILAAALTISLLAGAFIKFCRSEIHAV